MSEKIFSSLHQAKKLGSAIVVNDFIGCGNDRDCWQHPSNLDLCIKVAKPEQERPQNDIDFHYAQHLKKQDISGYHMPRVYGWVLTDKGPGLVFDLIRDYGGTVSKRLLVALSDADISFAQAEQIVAQAFTWLIENRVILADYGIDNLLVQNYAPGLYRIVIVDGLGARNFSVNYWINRKLGFKAVRKAREFHQMTLDLMRKHLGI